jgi:hypothetical protein
MGCAIRKTGRGWGLCAVGSLTGTGLKVGDATVL